MLPDDVNIGVFAFNACKDVADNDNIFVSNLLFFIDVGVVVIDVIPLLPPQNETILLRDFFSCIFMQCLIQIRL